MPTYVSFFRGINVGGQQVQMDQLKVLHEALGLEDVVTYIRSGNVIFTSDDTDVARLTRHIEDSFAQQFCFRVKVMLRTLAEIQTIIVNNPFQNQVIEELKWVVVLFLTNYPDKTTLEAFQQVYTGPEKLCLLGQELYTYYPDGIGRSKLTLPLIEKKLQTNGTGRNWNTILQLHELMQR